jgi:two-component system, chemotaxis family, sensor kinase CheA
MSNEGNSTIQDALNGVATRLIVIEGCDPSCCRAIGAEMRQVAATFGGRAAEYLLAAAAVMENAPDSDPAREIAAAEAGRLLGQAMDVSEDFAAPPVQPLAPLPAPVPQETIPLQSPPQQFPASLPAEQFPPAPAVDAAPPPPPPPPPAPEVPAAPLAEMCTSLGDDAPQPLPPSLDMELLNVVLSESAENLQSSEGAMLTLETNPSDQESINSVFRAFHTIKGICSFMGFTRIAELAHHAESLLCKVRDGKVVFNDAYADMSLRSVDMLKALLDGVKGAVGGQPMLKPAGYDTLLRDLIDPEAAAARMKQPAPPLPPRLGDILVSEGKVTREAVEKAEATRGDEPLGLALVQQNAASLADVGQALRRQQESKDATETSVRVRTDRLDRLIDTVGELVIAQSMLAADTNVVGGLNIELAKKVSHSGKIVRELQDLGMSMRMVPLKSTFQKMARVARDLSKKNGKEVEVQISGEETEIDRNMVAVVDGLLVHMVRNSLDHGLETPEERERAGKARKGTFRLGAYHSGGNIVFEIGDDGRGLNKARITAKAIERGLIHGAEGLSDNDINNLIFLPGFSTAEKLTDVSGRGVGMDVVKKGVEDLRGRIDINSVEGRGCTFLLKLPLTMAITDGIVVRVGSQRYVIPLSGIHLMLKARETELSTVTGSGQLLNLRGELMPVFRLYGIFGVKPDSENLSEGVLVVVEDRGRRYAFLVDELLGQQQVVAKALPGFEGRIPGVSGGAILGDGRVGLILDAQGLAALGRSEEGA